MEKMKTDEINYVFRYFSHLMTEHERLAYRHLAGTTKATLGRSDVEAQEQAKGSVFYLRELLSDDPSVLALASDGFETFVLRTGQRILNDHRYQIAFNWCPQCGALARTPTARQCRACRHDWHKVGTRSS